MQDNRGFTLMELLITLAILGIISTIAVTAYIGQQKRAYRAEAYANLQNLRLLAEQYFAENSCYNRTAGACADNGAALNGIAAIQALLPAFQPGNRTIYTYTYQAQQLDVNGNNVAGGQASCFVARAQGPAGSTVAGDDFRLDCRNQRLGW